MGLPATHLDFDAFFRAEFGPLVRALSVAVGSEVAADAVQDAFLQASVRWSRVGELESPGGWVRRVAVNRVIDHQRKTSRWGRRLREVTFVEHVEPDTYDIDLERSLAALPKQQRLAVTLYYLLDLPVVDVAAALGVSEGTVKSHLHDARRALRRSLEVADHA